jgi:glycosidase
MNHYPHAVTIGEVGGGITPEQSLAYVNEQNGPLHMVFNFDTCWENGAFSSEQKSDLAIRTNVLSMKQKFLDWYKKTENKAWLPIYWLNHDHPRVLSQYGSVQYRKESATLLITILLFMYGTPFIYNGDEIGMSNVDYRKLTQFKDVSAIQFAKNASAYLDEASILRFLRRTSRVNARTPMQWSDEPFAGFSTKDPYLTVNGNYPTVNVAQQERDKKSILHYFKEVIRLRKTESISQLVHQTPFELVDAMHPDVFAYRHVGSTTLLVIGNFRSYEVSFPFSYVLIKTLIHNYADIVKKGTQVILRAFEVYVFEVESSW